MTKTQAWRKKPVLRELYYKWRKQISHHSQMGPYLEIGAGEIGKFFDTPPFKTDIVRYPGIAVQCDAMVLPFKDETFGTVFMIDVWHHITETCMVDKVINELYRVTKTKGRLIMVEPVKSTVSKWFYTYIHHEKGMGLNDTKTAMEIIPDIQFTDPLIYPLSGGFSGPNLCPLWAYPYLEILERKLKPFARHLAWRMMVVLEKI